MPRMQVDRLVPLRRRPQVRMVDQLLRPRAKVFFFPPKGRQEERMIGPAAAHMRKRGNPNWGRPILPGPALATEFELQARRLHLAPGAYASSRELRIWCERNRNRVYVPEWLLKEWGILVDSDFSGAA